MRRLELGGLAAALRSDAGLAFSSWRVRLLLLLPPAAAAARVLFGAARAADVEARGIIAGASAAAAEPSAFGPFVDGMVTGLAVAYLLVVGLAAASIAVDRDTGAVRHLLVRRVSRPALVLSRMIFFTGVGLLLAAGVVLVSAAAAGAILDFTPVVEDGYELIGTAEMRAEILEGLALALTPLPAAVAFALAVSVSARSAVEAVAFALGGSILFDVFKGSLGDAAYAIHATYQPSLIDGSYLGDVARLVRGYSDVFVEAGVLRLNAVAPLVEALVLLVIALAVVRWRRM